MNHYDLLHGITNSLWYNLESEDLITIYKAMIARIKHAGYDQTVLQDENLNFIVDIMFGIIVTIYGDYGTSPRFGWIEDDNVKDEIISDLEEEIKLCKNRRDFE